VEFVAVRSTIETDSEACAGGGAWGRRGDREYSGGVLMKAVSGSAASGREEADPSLILARGEGSACVTSPKGVWWGRESSRRDRTVVVWPGGQSPPADWALDTVVLYRA
jgi:hypothetical protein